MDSLIFRGAGTLTTWVLEEVDSGEPRPCVMHSGAVYSNSFFTMTSESTDEKRQDRLREHQHEIGELPSTL